MTYMEGGIQMNRSCFRLCWGIFSLMISHISGAQQTLTVDSAIKEGLGHSPDIQRVRAAKSESEWHSFEILGAGFLPKISVNATHYFKDKYTLTSINFG